MCKKVVVFDLDDTLYNEIDFLKSGFHYISRRLNGCYPLAIAENIYNTMLSTYKMNGNAFDTVIEEYGLYNHPKEVLLRMYREHKPKIQLSDGAEELLDHLKQRKVVLGLITDGRTITQNNKIEALNIGKWIETDNIIINSEESTYKPNPISYWQIMEKYGDGFDYTYIGDNTEKDFIAPNQLGWTSICLLDNGKNIHKQNFYLQNEYLPQFKVESISEVLALI